LTRAKLIRARTAILLAALAVVGAVAAYAVMAASAAPDPGGSSVPSGQRTYGSSSYDPTTGHFSGGGGAIEPAYDDATGTLVYLQTPNNVPFNPVKKIDPDTGMPINVAPIYLPVYPAGSGIDPATLNCAHVPADNCPDHGPLISTVADQIMHSVYGVGVLGHDHLVGISKTGGDFNVLWEPVLVLFTNAAAATTHITTLAQIQEAVDTHNAIEVPLPQATFHCSSVSAAAYWRGTPAPAV
jgi:hypothetical protein